MKKRAKELRSEARAALKGNWLVAILVLLLAMILGAFNTSTLSYQDKDSVNKMTETMTQQMEEQYGEDFANVYADAITKVTDTMEVYGPVLAIISIVLFVVGCAVRLGYFRFNIHMVETNEAKSSYLFSRFGIILKAIGLVIMEVVFASLWMLLFIIPGIIAIYRYAMAEYIMAENPDVGILEAIRLSKKMMKGYKWRFFCLRWSFIGWELLSLITCGIGYIWVIPYEQAAFAAFYKMVSENYKLQSAN